MTNHKFLIYTVSVFTVFSFLSAQVAMPVSAKRKSPSLSTQQAALSRKLSNIRSGLNQKQAYCDTVQKNIKSLQSQIETESKKLDEISQNVNQKEAVLSQAQSEVEAQKDDIANRLCAIYKSGDSSVMEILLGAKDFSDLVDKADLIQQMSKQDHAVLDSLKDNLNTVETEKAQIEKCKEDAANFKASLDSKKAMLEKAEKENISSISTLKQDEIKTQSRLNQVMLEKKKLEEQISKFHASYSSSKQDSNYSKGRYSWPLPGFTHISSPYGGRRNHKGIDISGPGVYGATITAAADGVVIKANSSNSWGSGWGYHVMISHGDGYATQYAHCSSVLVSVGQHVKAGQAIAKVGNTGHSFGAHLHFETWKNGQRYNPAFELKG